MGEEIYRLVIVDFIFILAVTFIAEFCRRYEPYARVLLLQEALLYVCVPCVSVSPDVTFQSLLFISRVLLTVMRLLLPIGLIVHVRVHVMESLTSHVPVVRCSKVDVTVLL